MCGGIRSRRTPLLHAEMKQILHCAEGCCCRLQPAPAGLAIVAALEAELLQSPAATSHIQDAASAFCATSSPPSGTNSVPIAIPSSQHKTINKFSDNKNNNNYGKSIFSTALSPPSFTHNFFSRPSPDFLGACFFCKRVLGPAKDIYMYRGDRAFCSTECRYMHIVEDESLSSAIPIEQQQPQPYSSTNKATFTPLTTVCVLG